LRGDAQSLGGSEMGYTIHYQDESARGERRMIPMVFRDKVSVLEHACALRKAGFQIALIEGPNFAISGNAFEAYYGATRRRPGAPVAYH
jgi:hypothetical protein